MKKCIEEIIRWVKRLFKVMIDAGRYHIRLSIQSFRSNERQFTLCILYLLE